MRPSKSLPEIREVTIRRIASKTNQKIKQLEKNQPLNVIAYLRASLVAKKK